MATILYRSTDTGAPNLSDVAVGSLVIILKACMVDGYGTRTPHPAWSMPFSDLVNNKAVFKSLAGEHIRVDDNLDFRYADVRGYTSMTDVDTGVEPYPRITDIASYVASKRYSATVGGSWALLVSDEHFYFLSFDLETANTPSYPAGFFFGQYLVSNGATFSQNYMITGIDLSAWVATYSLYGLTRGLVNWIFKRPYWNDIKPLIALGYATESDSNQPNPLTGKLEFSQISLYGQSSAPYTLYGFWPNQLRSVGRSFLVFRGGEKLVIDGLNYVVWAHLSGFNVFKYDSDVD